MPSKRLKTSRVSRFVRRNITTPQNYEPRIERLLQVTGAASFSELVRRSLDGLESKYELPPMPAILDSQKKKPPRK